MIPRVEFREPGPQIIGHLRRSKKTAFQTPVDPGFSHRVESPCILRPCRIFTRNGTERLEPVIGLDDESLDDQRKRFRPEPYDPLVAWMHHTLREHRQVSRPGPPFVGVPLEASSQLCPVICFRCEACRRIGYERIACRGVMRATRQHGCVAGLRVNLHGWRFGQRGKTLSQSAPSCLVESKFSFLDLAHSFGDVVQEDVRPNFQYLSGAGDLTNRFQNPLDVTGRDGGGSLDHVLDELVAAKFGRGRAQGAGQL